MGADSGCLSDGRSGRDTWKVLPEDWPHISFTFLLLAQN